MSSFINFKELSVQELAKVQPCSKQQAEALRLELLSRRMSSLFTQKKSLCTLDLSKTQVNLSELTQLLNMALYKTRRSESGKLDVLVSEITEQRTKIMKLLGFELSSKKNRYAYKGMSFTVPSFATAEAITKALAA